MSSPKGISAIVFLLTVWSSKPVESTNDICGGKPMLKSGVSCEDIKAILDAHNKFRQMVAKGEVRGQPKASDMKELVWDDEIAQRAQKWADKCVIAHDSNSNLDVARFSVGQNIASSWTTDPNSDAKPDFPTQVKAWFDEVGKYSYGPLTNSPTTGHYTQIIWSETYLVGCGYSYYKDSARYTKLYVCNYGPAGNILGVPPYKKEDKMTCPHSPT